MSIFEIIDELKENKEYLGFAIEDLEDLDGNFTDDEIADLRIRLDSIIYNLRRVFDKSLSLYSDEA